jgi:hypothetical protein
MAALVDLAAICCVAVVGLLHVHADDLAREAVSVLRDQPPERQPAPSNRLAQITARCGGNARRLAAVFGAAAVGASTSHIHGSAVVVAAQLLGFFLLALAIYGCLAACVLGVVAYRGLRRVSPPMSKWDASMRSMALADCVMFGALVIAIFAYVLP